MLGATSVALPVRESPAGSRQRRFRIGQRGREEIAFYSCISPWLVGLVFLTVGPIVASLLISFTSYDVITAPKFVGLGNYVQMLTTDELVPRSLRVTATFTLMALPLEMIAALFLALVLNQKIAGVTLFRTIYYLPSVITGVPVALLWLAILRPNGVINGALRLVGIRGPSWLFSEAWVLPAFVIMSVWGIGGNVVINLAALQGVPKELYEAADIDGAGPLHKFRRITIPMISPVVLFNLVMGIIGSFQTFTTAYVMTNGGPNNATLFFALHLYRNAFKYYYMGYASALAWLLFAIILVVTLIILRSSPAWVYYEGMAR